MRKQVIMPRCGVSMESGTIINLQKREIDYFITPPHRWFREFIDKDTVERLLNDKERLVLVSGEDEICSGVRVLLTGGHSPGHQSVIVKGDRTDAVITGDVVFTYSNIEDDIPVGFNYNLEECLISMERIRRLNCAVLPGHDPLVFKRWNY